jgi:hypothetical protein
MLAFNIKIKKQSIILCIKIVVSYILSYVHDNWSLPTCMHVANPEEIKSAIVTKGRASESSNSVMCSPRVPAGTGPWIVCLTTFCAKIAANNALL